MNTKRFLDNGSPVRTTVSILKNNKYIKIMNPDKFTKSMISRDALGRIHSRRQDMYTVWILDESTSSTIIIEVPQMLMGQYFEPHQHGIFSHIAV